MENIVKATTTSNETVLINEDQVATVMPGKPLRDIGPPEGLLGAGLTAKVKMSNGDEFALIFPDWDMWENDLFSQNET